MIERIDWSFIAVGTSVSFFLKQALNIFKLKPSLYPGFLGKPIGPTDSLCQRVSFGILPLPLVSRFLVSVIARSAFGQELRFVFWVRVISISVPFSLVGVYFGSVFGYVFSLVRRSYSSLLRCRHAYMISLNALNYDSIG